MVLLDTSVLAHLIYPTGKAPIDPTTGDPVSNCQERLQHFVQSNQKTKILIAAPSYAEFLVHAGPRAQGVVDIFRKSSALRVVPFDESCALECSLLEGAARLNGDKRDGSSAPWQKVKVDRQILATALFHAVKVLYTDDVELRGLAQRAGLATMGVADMPLPESARQHRLELDAPEQSESPWA
jgi:hypothetical protein